MKKIYNSIKFTIYTAFTDDKSVLGEKMQEKWL